MKGIITNLFESLKERLLSSQGNILVYIVLTMLVFGVLGVTMVSLFSTSISSSATQNDTRRATYFSEAGIRYAMSEMLTGDFSKTTINNLNATNYNINPAGSFNINIFSPWFELDAAGYDFAVHGASIPLKVPEGEIPAGFLDTVPSGNPDFFLVNYNYFPTISPPAPADTAKSPVTAASTVSPTRLSYTLADDFVAAENEQLCMAVSPFSGGQDIPSQGYLDLLPVAKNIFPPLGGTFEVQRRNFFYANRDDSLGDRVRLTGITPVAGESLNDITVAANDPVILSPRNRLIVSRGRSGEVEFGDHMNYATGFADVSLVPPLSRKPDIEFEEEANLPSVLSQVKPGANPSFVTVDNTDKFLTIGGGTGPSLGAVWFQDTRNIGGVREFCNTNGCFFKNGIRAFFTLEYTGSGDGFIFALINGGGTDAIGNLKNDTASVGGDIERSEMLGYSGDSRLDVAGTQFLDNSGLYHGLFPPKIGLEFDSKVNISSGDNYCANSTSLRANTRNDPGTPAAQNRDAVQFVYWAANALDVPCRREPFCQSNPACTGDPSYDDNRHNALLPNWKFNTGGAVLSSPAIGSDGTIFVGSDSTTFFAINPDGTEKWSVDRSGPWFSPTVAGGRIYVGTGATENALYSLDSQDGLIVSGFPFATGGPVTTKPAVGTVGASDGIVYFGSDDGTFRAVNSSGTLEWAFTPLGLPAQPFRSSPAISASGGTVYFGSNNGDFYARRADNGQLVGTASVGTPFQSSPVVGPDGTVYVGNDNDQIYAFNGTDGTEIWRFNTGAPVRSSPALSNDGTRVYIGSESNVLFALNASTGAEIWRFTGASGHLDSPITVDANDHIYFGSDDDNVYALYPDGTQKWSFSTAGNVETKPAVKADGTVYAGSRDGFLYSISQLTDPVNLKNLLITSSGPSVGGVPVALTSEEDWLKGSSSKGPWAVRLEIARSQVQTGGTFAYNLKAWIRQCNAASCNDPIDPLGTFFQDTRVQYSPAARPPMIEQTVNLLPSDHADLERFIFGFTSQTDAGESQTATIRKFQLSFIRPNDPTVTVDPQWP